MGHNNCLVIIVKIVIIVIIVITVITAIMVLFWRLLILLIVERAPTAILIIQAPILPAFAAVHSTSTSIHVHLGFRI